MEKKKDISSLIIDIHDEIDRNASIFSDATVEYGKMGYALFNFYCHLLYKDSKFLVRGEQLIEDCIVMISQISETEEYIPKYRGDCVSNSISSFGKGLLFLEHNLSTEYDLSEYSMEFCRILLDLNNQLIADGNFDFFGGALGPGYFFLNRYYYKRDDVSKRALLDICRSIFKFAKDRNPSEVYWTSPCFYDKVYLGLSHGSAMIINFLTKLFEVGILTKSDTLYVNLLKKAINFVMSQKRDVINGYFPHYYEEAKHTLATQFSLCYGDLGILYVLKNAGSVLNYKKFDVDVSFMMGAIMERKLNKRHTSDASILYGCSGLYHVFFDLYTKGGGIKFLECSKYWFDQILSYWSVEKNTLAGFRFDWEDSDIINAPAKYSFAWGLTGIGMTLINGFAPDLPRFNELLFIGK